MYRIDLGIDGQATFYTLDEAKKFAGEIFELFGIVVGIEEV